MPRGRRVPVTADPSYGGEGEDFVCPFESEEINCRDQTGADWYRIMLAASLGGKSIHGLNPTPSCEVISKVTEEFAGKYATGRIKFNPKVRKIPSLGEGLTDQHFIHKDFKGISSGTGAFFAFDQGMWEPSTRKRAREASLLAATLASHTNDKAGACKIVAKITGDDISEDAVDVACVPVSHLKRDVVSVSKRSHRVFSCGALQRAITWEDSQLLGDKLSETAAMDWGRVIALSRTLAEGNIQIDPAFTRYAYQLGVPFALVKGSNAYVQYGDYVFDPKKFESVPSIDLKKYAIPSLKEAYNHAAESILKQCYLNLSRLSYEETSASAQAILDIIRDCKIRVRGTLPRRSTWTETDVLAGPGSHSHDAYSAARVTASEATSKNAFDSAYCQVVSQSEELIRLARRYAATRKEGQPDMNALDAVNKVALKQTTWEIAKKTLTDWLKNKNLAETRMASFKGSVFRSSTPLYIPHPLTPDHLVTARLVTGNLLPKAAIAPAPQVKNMHNMLSLRRTQGSGDMQQAVQNMMAHFTTYRNQWVKRYKDWISAYQSLTGFKARKAQTEYEALVTAFEGITTSTALAIDSRFIDGTAPRESYIFKIAMNYVRDIGATRIPLSKTFYKDASELARELDDTIKPLISFVHLEEECYKRLSWFAGDFGVDQSEQYAAMRDQEESEEVFDDVLEESGRRPRKRSKLAVDYSPGVVNVSGVLVALETAPDSSMADLEALLLDGGIEAREPSYEEVRGSYNSETAADQHAKANGYKDFLDAYTVLKGGARFDKTTEYTTKGLVASDGDKQAYDDGTILA